MSHNLMIQNGEASMFYVSEVPWHGLGTKLDKPATAEEVITAAKLDWEVEKLPLCAVNGLMQLPIPDRYAMVRKSSTDVLGIVGRDYTPLQNREAFTFFDPIVGKDAAIYHTAGALGNGERVWILAKLPDNIRVVGDDIAEKYLLMSNGHDGKSSVIVKFTPVRVVCQNTLTTALEGDGRIMRIVHNTDIHEQIKEAELMLGIIHKEYAGLEDIFRKMTRVQMTRERLDQYMSSVYPDARIDELGHEAIRVKRNRSWSEYFFDQGAGNQLPGIKGTLWAAFNGVTEWIDHHKTRQTQDQRLSSIWYGEASRIKQRAYMAAIGLIKKLCP